ncbi:ANTAR domain-containing response regulator [Streptomyces iconiensis]|uniref:ANTAR domain-containing protein n=1 Tax=Streptomyces iconiensis TaxID=1384038 RepID=A0ABT6ZUE7_9ACTN|nr:ANTAR domain-containing protein [Streptomyces iconiensis]MDJ1132683.1 ANTAR domain-containing protein [Streptomyces iconiensis]
MSTPRHVPFPGTTPTEAAHIDPEERPPGEGSVRRSLAHLAEQAARFSPDCCGAIATLTEASASGAAASGSAARGVPGLPGLPPGAGEPGEPSELEETAASGELPVAVTHPDLAGLVAVQRETGEGPIPTSLRTGRPAGGDDFLYSERWPEYRARALESGLRSSTTLPYLRDGLVLTLTVCSFRPYLLDEDVRSSTALLGDLAASVLVRDVRYRAALEEVEQLDTALRSRPVVDRACGIVMAVTACTDDEAFALLRRLSQRTNHKLYDLAEGIVRTRGRGLEEQLRRLGRTP